MKDDYMALIVQNGYPVLKLDVGNGVEQVINEKYVSDNVWYQFIVERWVLWWILVFG
jgi:laminin alpha 3/5